jgi:hypothetical protein
MVDKRNKRCLCTISFPKCVKRWDASNLLNGAWNISTEDGNGLVIGMSNSEPSSNNLEMRLTSLDLLRSLGHLGDCLYKPANIFNSETAKICFIRFEVIANLDDESIDILSKIGKEKSVSDDRDSHNEADTVSLHSFQSSKHFPKAAS